MRDASELIGSDSYGFLLTDHGSRITDHGSRITDHGSRITDHPSRVTTFLISNSYNNRVDLRLAKLTARFFDCFQISKRSDTNAMPRVGIDCDLADFGFDALQCKHGAYAIGVVEIAIRTGL